MPTREGARSAALATVGAIALHGIHQAGIEPGSRVAVIGLGPVGQLTLRLLAAYGYDAAGVDSDPSMVKVALVRGDSVPEADFRQSPWTPLATCRLASTVDAGRAVTVEPATPALCEALGMAADLPIPRAVAN